MKCKKCGEELPERARFCPACGTPVEEVPAPRKLEKPLEPMGFGAVPLVPIAPPPRATRVTPRVPRPYGAARAGHSSLRIPLSAYPTFRSDAREEPAKEASPEPEPELRAAKTVEEDVEVSTEAPEAEETVEVEPAHAPEEAEGTVEVAAEQVAEAEAEDEKNDKPDVEKDDAPEADVDVDAPGPEPELESEDDANVEPAPESDMDDESEAAPEPEPEPETEPELETEPEPEIGPEAKHARRPAPAPIAASEPEPECADPEDALFEATQTMSLEPVPEPATTEPEPAPAAAPLSSFVDRAREVLASLAGRARAALPQSTDQRALIGIGALVGVVAVAFLVYVSLGWFGPFADRSYVAPEVQPPSDGSIEPLQQQEAEEEEAPLVIEGGPEVRGTLGEYSWPELAQISALISAAETDEKGVEIAHYYGLCDADGTIYTDNTKSLDLANGVSVPMAIAGFRHDARSDGAGAAGISLVARGSVGTEPMNALAQTSPGWEGSTLRAWVNEGLLAQFPAELADLLVAVNKVTNPAPGSGLTEQTVTSDRVWLLSYSEIVGEIGQGSRRFGVYRSEGGQYQLFADLGVTWSEPAPQIAIASGEYWWERSPDPTNSAWFMCVSPEGEMGYGHRPATPDAVVIGFCL